MGQSRSSLALLSHTRFHCPVTFDPQQEKTTAISSSLDAQEFNSLCPIAPVMSISPPPQTPMPVAPRWIMVGVIEMAAAPREEKEEEEEEGED